MQSLNFRSSLSIVAWVIALIDLHCHIARTPEDYRIRDDQARAEIVQAGGADVLVLVNCVKVCRHGLLCCSFSVDGWSEWRMNDWRNYLITHPEHIHEQAGRQRADREQQRVKIKLCRPCYCSGCPSFAIRTQTLFSSDTGSLQLS